MVVSEKYFEKVLERFNMHKENIDSTQLGGYFKLSIKLSP